MPRIFEALTTRIGEWCWGIKDEMVETPGIVNQRLGGGSTRRRWYIVDGSVSIVKHPPSAIQLVVRWRFAGLAGIWQALNRTLNICTHNIHGERGYLYFMLVRCGATVSWSLQIFKSAHAALLLPLLLGTFIITRALSFSLQYICQRNLSCNVCL